MLEIVRSDEDVHAAHHRVSGMNFIPGGYAVPPSVREQRAEAESQLVVSTAPETDTQPLSPAPTMIQGTTMSTTMSPPLLVRMSFELRRRSLRLNSRPHLRRDLQMCLVEIIAGEYPRASKLGINSACGGCFQRTASILSGMLRTSEEAIPLTERSN